MRGWQPRSPEVGGDVACAAQGLSLLSSLPGPQVYPSPPCWRCLFFGKPELAWEGSALPS